MQAMQFNEVLFDQFAKMEAVLAAKADEYAGGNDRLANFKKAAALQGITPEQACHGMMTKHIVSVSDMVQSGKEYPMAMWEEKLGDALNYYVLLKALVVERHTADLS